MIIRGLRGDEYIAQIRLISAKGEHIRRLIETAVSLVVATHEIVGNEDDRERTPVDLKFRYQHREKTAEAPLIDGMLPLLVDDQPTVSSRVRLFVQTEAIAGARCSAWNNSHMLGRSAVQEDGGPRLVH